MLKVAFFSEDIIVLVISSNFGTKTFFIIIYFEIYRLLPEDCLLINQKA
jgi:hypothetical protein